MMKEPSEMEIFGKKENVFFFYLFENGIIFPSGQHSASLEATVLYWKIFCVEKYGGVYLDTNILYLDNNTNSLRLVLEQTQHNQTTLTIIKTAGRER